MVGAIEGTHALVALYLASLLIHIHVIVKLEIIYALAIGKGEAFARYCGGGIQ
jgi:hypothetical protein